MSQHKEINEMHRYLMTAFLAGTLFAGLPLFGAQVSFGIQIGPPPPPRIERVRPVAPGPDYVWVDGYWYPVARRTKSTMRGPQREAMSSSTLITRWCFTA